MAPRMCVIVVGLSPFRFSAFPLFRSSVLPLFLTVQFIFRIVRTVGYCTADNKINCVDRRRGDPCEALSI